MGNCQLTTSRNGESLWQGFVVTGQPVITDDQSIVFFKDLDLMTGKLPKLTRK